MSYHWPDLMQLRMDADPEKMDLTELNVSCSILKDVLDDVGMIRMKKQWDEEQKEKKNAEPQRRL